MFWFIFSEVMFFFAFFGALFYVRVLVGPWLAGEGEAGAMNHLLWEGFEFSWPMMQTPQEAVGGAAAQVIANNGEFVSARAPAWPSRGQRLVQVAAAVEHHHPAVLQRHRCTSRTWACSRATASKFNLWLGITVVLAHHLPVHAVRTSTTRPTRTSA